MDMDNSEVIAGEGIRGLKGNRKNTIKNSKKKEESIKSI